MYDTLTVIVLGDFSATGKRNLVFVNEYLTAYVYIDNCTITVLNDSLCSVT